jgi:hypothetical protein
MSMHAKWNNVLSALFEKRTGYTHIQQARPALACIKAYNAPILCSFVWRIHHVNWQVAELLTITCQISETTGRCTQHTTSSCAERCAAEINWRLYFVFRIYDYIALHTHTKKKTKQNQKKTKTKKEIRVERLTLTFLVHILRYYVYMYSNLHLFIFIWRLFQHLITRSFSNIWRYVGRSQWSSARASLQPIACWSRGFESRWSRSLRRKSVVSRLLGLRVRIQPGAWIFVSCVISKTNRQNAG